MNTKSINNYSTVPLIRTLYVREDDPAALAAKAQAEQEAAIAKRIADEVQKAVERETTGLKNKNDELLGKLKKEQDRVRQFDGMNPEELKALKDKLDNDEDTRLLTEGKKNEVIDKYTQRMRAEHENQKKELAAKIKAESDRAEAYREKVLENAIRQAAGGIHKEAIEDAILHGTRLFSLDAKGNAVALDPDGRPILGKDGLTPLSPTEWMEQQRELKPHWFPASTSGGGASASRDASSFGGKTITRADFDKLPARSKSEVLSKNMKIVD